MFLTPTYKVTAYYQLRTVGFIQPQPVKLTINRIKADKSDIETLVKAYIEQSENSPVGTINIDTIERV